MGLVTETVEICITMSNYKHYQSKGYELPKKADGKIDWFKYITVKTEDLSKGCSIKIEYACDCCNEHFFTNYNSYYNTLHNGKKYCLSCANKLFKSGENNPFYNPNLTKAERTKGRNYPEYKEFVKAVLARDNYTCQCCGKKSHDVIIDVHHLYGYAHYPEYRTDQTQSLVLCENCHTAFHNWHHQTYGLINRGKNTREQFEEWWGQVVQELKEYNGVLPITRKIFDYEEQQSYQNSNEYAQIHNCHISAIHNCCNRKITHKPYICKDGTTIMLTTHSYTVKGHHLFWLDEYEKMTEDDVINYLSSCVNKTYKKVICLNTSEVFDSIADIAKKYPFMKNNTSNVSACCLGKYKYCGKLEDGTPLKWLYYEDYIAKTENEINNILNEGVEKQRTIKPVICLSTGVKYNSAEDAARVYNVHKKTIQRHCHNKNQKFQNNMPPHWMYYSEFKQLTEEKQNNLLKLYKEE